MAQKTPSPAHEFVVDLLREDPSLDFRAVKAAADAEGLIVLPIVYGRAKKALGLAKPAAEPTPKAVASTPAKPAAAKPRARTAAKAPRRVAARQAAPASFESLSAVIGEMKAIAAERDRYRKALERIATVLEAELG